MRARIPAGRGLAEKYRRRVSLDIRQKLRALRALFDAETDPEAKRIFREGLERGAADASGTAAECEKFDNSKNGEFKLADWRRNFGKQPQNSQKEVEKVALGQLKIPEIWERRNYERRFMTIPLSAAAICAFSGKPEILGFGGESGRAL